jgi:hypothetical protein
VEPRAHACVCCSFSHGNFRSLRAHGAVSWVSRISMLVVCSPLLLAQWHFLPLVFQESFCQALYKGVSCQVLRWQSNGCAVLRP